MRVSRRKTRREMRARTVLGSDIRLSVWQKARGRLSDIFDGGDKGEDG